ncbi:MAG: long-chain acyl-CoA synthetase [Saprospiraceae bacterium]|jgi:long-chain acyl-CoA synthetase
MIKENNYHGIISKIEEVLDTPDIIKIHKLGAELDKLEIPLLPFRICKILELQQHTSPEDLLHKGIQLLLQAQHRLVTINTIPSFADLYSIIKRYSEEMPNVIAITHIEDEITWKEFHQNILRIATYLKDLNISTGDRVGILADNSIHYLEILVSIVSIGACVVPLPTKVTSKTIQILSQDAELNTCFVSDNYKTLIEHNQKEFKHKIAIDFYQVQWTSMSAILKYTTPRRITFKSSPEDYFDIMYSSGTTGLPKGIVHTSGVRSNQYIRGHQMNYWSGSKVIFSTPLYSNTTLVSATRAIAAGSKIILMSKFHIDQFLGLCEHMKVTHAILVPVQLQRIMASPLFDNYDLSNFELIYTTSAPLKAQLKKEIVERWPGNLIEIYSMTEGGILSILHANKYQDKLHTVGKPPSSTILKILGENDKELPNGEIGEIVGHDHYRMKEYHNKPQETKAATWYDGLGKVYQRSGDFGAIDDDGFLILHGRKKEVIISGGYNIYAIDLENLIKGHHNVKEAAVIGIPSEKWGETPLAFVEVVEASDSRPENILKWANDKLGKIQQISKVEIKEKLPRSGIGKVLKKELKKSYWPKL